MPDQPMSVTGHLAELRRRVFVSLIALVAGIVVSFIFRERIFDILTRPGPDDLELFFFTLTGAIGPTMKVALLGGFIVALPVIVHQAVGFIAPGLTGRERRYLYLLLPGVAVCFMAGVAFAYFVLVPPIVEFLLDFGGDIAEPRPSLGSYIDTVTALLFWMGVAFETPFLMYFLTLIGVANPRFFARQRRAWLVISFVLGALITPTFDPINQTMVAGPFIVLYEIGILLSRVAARRPRRRAPAASDGGEPHP
ncbi:MAG: twin-arginine translocase subunit TatC [Dehalococcoidia bacterium]